LILPVRRQRHSRSARTPPARSGIFHDINLAIQGRSPSHLTQAWPQILLQQIRCCGAKQGAMKLELFAGGMANLSIAAGVVCIGF
jgi:hypothetical protein